MAHEEQMDNFLKEFGFDKETHDSMYNQKHNVESFGQRDAPNSGSGNDSSRN